MKKSTKTVTVDNRKRELRKGEDQQPDGRYRYRYKDLDGTMRSVYSWRLVDADTPPEGRGDCEPLRVIERKISETLSQRRSYYDSEHVTVNDLYEKFIDNSTASKATVEQYKRHYAKHIRPVFGDVTAADIVISDVTRFFNSMIRKGYKEGTIKNIRILFKDIIDVGVNDDILIKNAVQKTPLKFNKNRNNYAGDEDDCDEIEDYSRLKSLTKEQQAAFTEWIKFKDYAYAPVALLMLYTGMRVGEATCLKWKDIDFQKRTIRIKRTLHYEKDPKTGSHLFYETLPKTKSSIRTIDMDSDVYDLLKDIHDGIKILKRKDEYIFQTRGGRPVTRNEVQAMLNNAVKSYNKSHSDQLPHIHNHMFRHTFITRMFEMGKSPKLIAAIVGHSDIKTTMNVYTDVQDDMKKEAIKGYEEYRRSFGA